MARIVAALAALVGWSALILQLWLIVENLGVLFGLWRFAGYFTILTNLGAAIVATAMALGIRRALTGARARLMAATSIALVGLVYSIALRGLWQPTGLQKVADMALHDAAPVLFVAAWALAHHPGLAWRELGWGVLPPVLYAVYALGRGQVDGWYAYWFLDPARQGLAELLSAIALLAVFTGVLAAAFVWIDRKLAARAVDRVPARG